MIKVFARIRAQATSYHPTVVLRGMGSFHFSGLKKIGLRTAIAAHHFLNAPQQFGVLPSVLAGAHGCPA